jgi:hypothetical protein
MELKVTHIEATIPQLTFVADQYHGLYDHQNGFLNFYGQDVNDNVTELAFYIDQFPLTEDTGNTVVYATVMDIDGNMFYIRTHAQPSISINGNEVTLTYTDCLLPLNGTNGTIIVKFINQL